MRPTALFLLTIVCLATPCRPTDDDARALAVRPAAGVAPANYYRKTHALCVGVNDYAAAAIPDLSYAENDAKAVAELLRAEYGFDRVNVLLGAKATKAGLTDAVAALFEPDVVSTDDAVLIYFAGHGQTVDLPRNGGQMGYLIPQDARIDLARPDDASAYYRTCVPMQRVKEWRDQIPARHVLIVVDACYSGLLANDRAVALSKPIQDALSLEVCQILTAGARGQTAKELSTKGHGAFTWKLLEGLRTTAADSNKDGFIRASELGVYLKNTHLEGQTPQSKVMDGEGDFVLVPQEKRYPVAIVSSGGFYSVDDGGFVLAAENVTGNGFRALPFITGLPSGSVVLGEFLDVEGLSDALDLIVALKKLNHDIYRKLSEAHLDPDEGLVVYFAPGAEVIFGHGSPIAKLSQLEYYFKQHSGLKGIDRIDLREPGSPRVPPPSAPTPSAWEQELARDREREVLLTRAKAAFESLKGLESQPVKTKEEAEKRRRFWQGYLKDYGATGHRLEEARAYVKQHENWTSGPKTGDTKTLNLGGGVELTLVWIEGGSFEIGSLDGEEDRGGDEGSVQKVMVDGFWIGQTEVTQAQYEAVTGKNPSWFKGPQNPVEKVSWNDAKSFCDELSRRVKEVVRLPTEAEWEYACRAGTSTPFHTGTTISTDQANYDGDYAYDSGRKGVDREKTTRVRSFAANGWGLYDMHGNVDEWCEDRIGISGGLPSPNPLRSSSGEYRALRGGSWGDNPYNCRSAVCLRVEPDYATHRDGFRIVCVSLVAD